jgi:hypothetical protein
MTPDFIPGLTLSEAFYHEAVRPVVDGVTPGLPHSAALIGPGSEVLGFDTSMSTDHDWGPRLQLFLPPGDHVRHAAALDSALQENLPRSFRGYPVGFLPPTPDDPGTYMLDYTVDGPINHRVEVLTLPGFLAEYLNVGEWPLAAVDWLTLPAQKLRTITAGAVFHDDVGLGTLRDSLAWYPHDVWLYLLAAGWQRIGEEEHLMGRAGFAGDAIGSALIGARLVRDVMRLAFLMAREYPPYPKWFGTAFARLDGADDLLPHLQGALAAPDWQAREVHLCPAYEALARQHNALGLTPPLPAAVTAFHNRPFRVIGGERFAQALVAQIADPDLRALAAKPLIGGLDQFSDNTCLQSYALWRPGLRGLYDQA